MSNARNWVIGIIVLLVLVGPIGLLYQHLHVSAEPVVSVSDAAGKNHMLAAERYLDQNGYASHVEPTLSTTLFHPVPDGTLILAQGGDSMLVTQAQSLLEWVKRGNTLVVMPGFSYMNPVHASPVDAGKGKSKEQKHDDSPDAAAAQANDTISSHFGITRATVLEPGHVCMTPVAPEDRKPEVQKKNDDDGPVRLTMVDCTATIDLPGVAHPLRLEGTGRLDTLAAVQQKRREAWEEEARHKAEGKKDDASTPQDDDDDEPAADEPPELSNTEPERLFADKDARTVRAYTWGKGRVVFVAVNYFDNNHLARYDHGELLLGLAGLSKARNVTMIQRIDVAPWYALLWHAAPYAICSAALLLCLVLWRAVRRFGPMLPDPDDRRRALLEHVDASGRWLWKTTKGREIMLAAMRRATERTLARRIPALRRLAPERQIERLAGESGIGRTELERALHDAPARLPIDFTKQVQTLQDLRKHYER